MKYGQYGLKQTYLREIEEDYSKEIEDTFDYIDNIKKRVYENLKLQRKDIQTLRNIITKKETFNFKNMSKIDTKKIGYVPVSYGVEIYYDKKPKLLFSTCLENEAIEIVKILKMFIKGEEDEKIYSKYFRG